MKGLYKQTTKNLKTVKVHRLIMEKHIGRKLTRKEEVHHLNGNKFDNRIENLVLCSSHAEHMKYHYPEAVFAPRICEYCSSIYYAKRKPSGKMLGHKLWLQRKYCSHFCAGKAQWNKPII